MGESMNPKKMNLKRQKTGSLNAFHGSKTRISCKVQRQPKSDPLWNHFHPPCCYIHTSTNAFIHCCACSASSLSLQL